MLPAGSCLRMVLDGIACGFSAVRHCASVSGPRPSDAMRLGYPQSGLCNSRARPPRADSFRDRRHFSPFLKLDQVADLLATSFAQDYALIRRGELPAIK